MTDHTEYCEVLTTGKCTCHPANGIMPTYLMTPRMLALMAGAWDAGVTYTWATQSGQPSEDIPADLLADNPYRREIARAHQELGIEQP